MSAIRDSLETEILAHRYLYYVLAAPVISDRVYDELEKTALESAPHDSPLHEPGSDLASSYPEDVITRAKELMK